MTNASLSFPRLHPCCQCTCLDDSSRIVNGPRSLLVTEFASHCGCVVTAAHTHATRLEYWFGTALPNWLLNRHMTERRLERLWIFDSDDNIWDIMDSSTSEPASGAHIFYECLRWGPVGETRIVFTFFGGWVFSPIRGNILMSWYSDVVHRKVAAMRRLFRHQRVTYKNAYFCGFYSLIWLDWTLG